MCASCVTVLLLIAGPTVGQDRQIVVIDPGHGGAETGVQAHQIQEKDFVLRAAFVLGGRRREVRSRRAGEPSALTHDGVSREGTAVPDETVALLHPDVSSPNPGYPSDCGVAFKHCRVVTRDDVVDSASKLQHALKGRQVRRRIVWGERGHRSHPLEVPIEIGVVGRQKGDGPGADCEVLGGKRVPCTRVHANVR